MLKTIRMPNNIHYLTNKLPEANYSPIKTKSIGKESYLHKKTMPDLGNRGMSGKRDPYEQHKS